MSGIVGVAGWPELAEAESLVRGMVSKVGRGSCRQTLASGCGGAVGSAGLGRAMVTGDRQVLAALDGELLGNDNWGATEAESLVRMYRKDGLARVLEHIHGDYAFGIVESDARSACLVRDRLGVRPLYYVAMDSWLAFASAPRALRLLPGVDSAPNPRYVALYAGSHYRTFDHAPSESPFSVIRRLPAGHALEWVRGRLRIWRYWSLTDADDERPESVLADEYRWLLLDAVDRRLERSKRAAFTLSGGMDSSSVLSCAVRVTSARQHAFSAVYEDVTYDESGDIRTILRETVEAWHRVPVAEIDLFDLIGRMIQVHGEPMATATWLSHYLLCEAVSQAGFDTLFGGLGGDELNAGEYEHFLYHFADLRAAGDESALRHEVGEWVRHHNHPIFRKSADGVEQDLARLIDMEQPGVCRPDRRRIDRYAGAINADLYDVSRFVPESEHPFRSYLKNRTWQDLTRETIPCCLRAADRNCRAFGLTNMEPFLDHRLVEFMFRVPGRLKIQDGITKRLLREAMRGVVPEATRTRIKKTGWNAPAHLWFVGAGRDQLHDLIASRSFAERGIYNISEVRRIVDEHETIVLSGAARENHMMFLWQLVNLELWLRALEVEPHYPWMSGSRGALNDALETITSEPQAPGAPGR